MALAPARRATPVLIQRVLSSVPSSQGFSVSNTHKLIFSPSFSFQSSLFSWFLSPAISKHPHHGYCQSPFPNQYTYESSDFEADERDQDEPHMESVLKILFEVKELPTEEGALGALGASGVTPTENLIFGLLLRLKNEWRLALLVFQWGVSKYGHSGFGPKVRHLVIWILAKHNRFDLAWSLIRTLHQHSMVTSQTLLIMIKRYCAANDPYRAIKTFHAMDVFKTSTSQSAFHTFLRALCNHRNVEEAEELVFSNKKFFPPETETFNILLDGWCNIMVDLVEAKRVWRQMLDCCILPDATTYSHMICCFSKHGNLFDSLRLYDEMRKRGLVPGIAVYNSLIYVLSKENCVEEALNILDKIGEANLQPDVTTYNSLIYPLCESHKIKKAYSILDDMIHKGVKPTTETYHAFIRAEHMRGKLDVMKRMRRDSCGPTAETFLQIFENLSKAGQPWFLLDMWAKMKKYDIIAEPVHYNIVLHGLLSCGRYLKARELYKEMKSKGFLVDPKLDIMLKKQEAVISNKNQEKHKAQVSGLGGHVKDPSGYKRRRYNKKQALRRLNLKKVKHQQKA
ncbi:pentatricopeptide repeat-containing protein At1g80880, mitochondrial [Nymphaea colorata]|nr:pentatricopeptide repeat-containing protein At1g80880, mitochondrial [Nymphaea colorata]